MNIRNWLLPLASTIAVMVIGCNDSVIESTTHDEQLPAEAYEAPKLEMNAHPTLYEIPTYEEMMTADAHEADSSHVHGHHSDHHGSHHPVDSSHHGDSSHSGHHHWQDRGHDHEFAPMTHESLHHIAQQLGLSHEQDSLFRLYIADYRQSVNDTVDALRALRELAYQTLKRDVHALHDSVEEGLLNEHEGRARLHEINAAYGAVIENFIARLHDAVAILRAEFHDRVLAILDEHQRGIWNHLHVR
jgi:hypothetical protein